MWLAERHMSDDSHTRGRQRYADRWADYVRYKIDTTKTGPVGFVIKARNREDAQQIAPKLADGRFQISRKWWPFGRRWQLVAKSRPMPLARESVDAWFERVLQVLTRYDGEFADWVPVQGLGT